MANNALVGFARKAVHGARALQLRATGAPTLHCIGDSHTFVFEHLRNDRSLRHTILKACIVNGATATGILNPNSSTHARPILESYISQVPAKDHVLISLGEVDCGFVIWYRAQKHGTPVEDQFRQTLTSYFDYLKQLKTAGHPNLIVMSVPPPTIKDGQDWGEVADKRREVQTTLAERTAMTLKFNQHLREFVKQNGMRFLDVEPYLIDPQTGVVDERFLNLDPLDHHLEHRAIVPILVRLLREMGFR